MNQTQVDASQGNDGDISALYVLSSETINIVDAVLCVLVSLMSLNSENIET